MKRYDLVLCDGESGTCHARMDSAVSGDYVLYDDCATLQADYDSLAALYGQVRARKEALEEIETTLREQLTASQENAAVLATRLKDAHYMIDTLRGMIPRYTTDPRR